MNDSLLRTKKLVRFQADNVAQTFLDGSKMWVWDTGLGKSIGSVALSALAFEQQDIDQVMVVCERNKVREWIADFTGETDLTTFKHHGSSRWKQLQRFEDKHNGRWPDVLVTTYETSKQDLMRKAGPRKMERGPLLNHLLGKRVLVIYDESNKLKNRSSMTHKAHAYMLRELRKQPHRAVRVLALTGTPIDTGYEDVFSQLMLVVPHAMPLVKNFEQVCVKRRDPYGRPTYHQPGVHAFMEICRPHLSRKRKTDQDVADQFPEMTETFRFVEMTADHRLLYRTVEKAIFTSDKIDEGSAWMTLRQVAGHPGSIIYAAQRSEGSQIAKDILSVLGEDHLRSIRCAKADELLSYLQTVVEEQGDKAIVFTYFGRSILRCLLEMLTDKGIPVFTYHGENTGSQNDFALRDFKGHTKGAVLLASDAAARGINVPEASYVIEYDAPTTYSLHVQRLNRAHRMGQGGKPVTGLTLATEGTVEEGIINSLLRRNQMHDAVVGDIEAEGDHMLAADRKAIMQAARSRYNMKK